MTKKVGRPSKYKSTYCQKLINYFSVDPCRTTIEKFYYKNGDEKEKEIEVANELPFISGFEIENNLSIGRLSKWCKAKKKNGKYRYPKFRQAYKKAKALQKMFLINNGLRGLYTPAAYCFTAKNITKMRDQHQFVGDPKNPIEVRHRIMGMKISKDAKRKNN